MNLAPNGKPSNLTPEQYRLVRTPQFISWFGNWENSPETASKVVDENGEPLVVYHGTDEEFTIFDVKAKSKWINQKKIEASFFSETERGALSYLSDIRKYLNNREGGKILKCFVKLINPIVADAKVLEPSEWYQADEKEGYVYSIQYKKEYVIEDAKRKGNDGVIFLNAWDNVPIGKIITTFYPNQIKLADGTNTTFDSKNPDIRFSLGGEIEEYKKQGILDLNFYPTNSKHAKEHGIDAKNPLYLQNLIVKESDRLKFIGKKVLLYLDEYAKQNGNDVIFGYVNQKATMTKDNRTGYFTEFTDVDWIKHWLFRNGYCVKRETNNFYKVLDKEKKDTTFDSNNPDIRFKTGGSIRKPKKRTISQTPAPNKDRIYGSKINKPKSSESKSKASSIILSPSVIKSIRTKINQHNEEYPNKKIPLSSAKAVVRRGMGAYSSTHRPTISGGKPNSRVAWGLARLNAFIYKIVKGKSKSGKYKQDDDLINELGYRVKPYAYGGQITDEQKETYKKWKELVNMSRSELEKFYNSEEGKVAGLSPSEAKKAGIDSGRESARWIMKMKYVPVKEWNSNMWRWAKKQISFISRMSGVKGKLYDEKGRKTRKHLALLIWGHNPEKQ